MLAGMAISLLIILVENWSSLATLKILSKLLTITVNPECAEEQPAVTLKYQHKHLHQTSINHSVTSEIIDFIGKYKTSALSIIEELLHKDKWFDGKLDNVTSQQIYNYWLSSTSRQWKLDPAEFTSSKMHIAVSEGWESLGMDVEDVYNGIHYAIL